MNYTIIKGDFMTLDTCTPNRVYVIHSIEGSPSKRRHFYHLGFLEGANVRCVFTAPCGDPIAFEVQGSVFALRKEQLKTITVSKEEG